LNPQYWDTYDKFNHTTITGAIPVGQQTLNTGPELTQPHLGFNYPSAFGHEVSEFYALSKFSNKVRENAMTWVTIAEAGKTVGLVRETLKTFTKAFRFLIGKKSWKRFNRMYRTLRFPKGTSLKEQKSIKLKAWLIFKDVNRTATSKWMAYRYGWTPFVRDIEDHSKALAQLMTRDEDLVSASAYAHYMKPFSVPLPVVPVTNVSHTFHLLTDDGKNNLQWTSKREIERTKVGVAYLTKYTGVFRVGSKFDEIKNTFQLDNLPLVALELTPLSWMADWFIPFSDTLNTLTKLNSVEWVDMCKINKSCYQNVIHLGDFSPTVNINGIGFKSTSTSTDKDYQMSFIKWQRTRVKSLPSPTWSLELLSQHYKRRIGLNQMIDAYSIFTNVVSGTKLRNARI
jgi:hypothetical protein